MIEARSSPRFERLFAVYAAWTVRRHFRAVYVRGTLPDTRAPLLVCVHHAWLVDPILLFHLSRRRFPGRHFTMMEEANLRRFGFFRRLGAFGIDRASKNGPLASLRYALKRLSEPTSRVWIFPQGTITRSIAGPSTSIREPRGSRRGRECRLSPSRSATSSARTSCPEAFVSFSLPELVRVERTVDEDPVRELLTSEADDLRDAVWSGGLDEFERVVSGRRSISDRFRPS
ncbi:MAG: lysophospholipid acyltransferase family protein [Blastocatellia bacterium]|nr:lysophospholipid acyltransferase family protein [Blastocatellia bacterium]